MLKFVVVSVVVLFVSSVSLSVHEKEKSVSKSSETAEDTFDFIIVGSGSAGSVLAARLSEIPEWRILLLEVGHETTNSTDVPLTVGSLQLTDLNWNYKMEPQPDACLGMENQVCGLDRGRALGGSTVTNYMSYIRGNKRDYDRWAKMGNPGWSYEEVLPYFKKSEDSNLAVFDPKYHRKGGFLHVEDVAFRPELSDAFLEAGKLMGMKAGGDYNGEDQFGFFRIQATTKNGRRVSVFNSLLNKIRNRENLMVSTGSYVTKILVDPTTKKATGVEYVKNNVLHVAKAEKEVLVSAGALNSPQLLMLSGIGPEGHLKKVGIPLVKDLPVGRNFIDHLCTYGLVFTVNDSVGINNDLINNPKAHREWLEGRGPFTSLGAVEGLAYINTNVSKDRDYPDIEIMFVSIGFGVDKGAVIRKMMRFTDTVYDQMWKPTEGRNAFMILPILLHPKSTGYVELRSSNPFEPPKFFGNYFQDPNDMETLLAALKYSLRLVETKPFKKYDTKINDIPVPGCEDHPFGSDDYWKCMIRHLTHSKHNQLGTCKMGPKTDKTSVVDHNLKVHGIQGLRVIDTSVIPISLSGHINAPAIMIGEKGADLVRNEWTV